MAISIKKITKLIDKSLPDNRFVGWTNWRNSRSSNKHRLTETGEAGLFRVEDGAESLVICRRSRHIRSKLGVRAGIDRLAEQYSLDKADVTGPGLFIDCGANIGEMGLWATAKGLSYMAFEPEEMEARCCDLNNFDGRPETHRMALWNSDTTLDFYEKPSSADSSVFEMKNAIGKRTVKARRLDGLLADEDLTGTVIIKIEAEGAEPEVLEGATGILEHVDFVAVDCGFERGKDRQHTFVETSQLLGRAGFEPVAAEMKRITVLYQRRRG